MIWLPSIIVSNRNQKIPDFSKKSGIYILNMITSAIDEANDESQVNCLPPSLNTTASCKKWSLTLPGLKTRGFYREFQSISLSYPSFRQGSLNIWVLALILFAITGRIISDKRNFPRVPR